MSTIRNGPGSLPIRSRTNLPVRLSVGWDRPGGNSAKDQFTIRIRENTPEVQNGTASANSAWITMNREEARELVKSLTRMMDDHPL